MPRQLGGQNRADATDGPTMVRYGPDPVYLSCYFPMPFFRSARVELTGADVPVADVEWKIRSTPYRDPANHAGYFHATYRDHSMPEPGEDLVLLDTTKTVGGGDWSGQFVGTSFIFLDANVLNTLEDDPRFFFDDSRTPQAQGTGTEEWGGGGDYWGGENMTLPFAGHPTGAKNAQTAGRRLVPGRLQHVRVFSSPGQELGPLSTSFKPRTDASAMTNSCSLSP